MASALLCEAALAALYLRRLGFPETEAAELAGGQPLAGAQNNADKKALLNDLVRAHVLRIPFENLEQHAVPASQAGDGGVAVPRTSVQDRLARLGQVRQAVERLALGACGGLCYDLNLPFCWLLRHLGATARLVLAWQWNSQDKTYTPDGPTHAMILVELADGPVLVDPGRGDPPRAAVSLAEGETSDDMAAYEVVDNAEAQDNATAAFQKVLRVRRQKRSLCRHVGNLDDAELDGSQAEWTTLYCFRPNDDLAYDAEELQTGMNQTLSPGSLFSSKRIVCLGTPKGHIVLSESRKRRVEGCSVVEEVLVENEAAWQREAQSIFSHPLLSTTLGEKVNIFKAAQQVRTQRRSVEGVAQISRSQTSQDTANSKSSNLGKIDAQSIAVGGAGAGGGLGLNAPGHHVKVQHFIGRGPPGSSSTGAPKKILEVNPEVVAAWRQVVDDSNPLAWIYCSYSADGKTLELQSSGLGGLSEFKSTLGTSIAWGGFRCYGVDKRGHLECKRPKFIFVQHKPESAGAIKKAKQASHKGAVKEALTGAHLDIAVENPDDLDEQILITKLQGATGAHKPNGYMFEEGVLIEADFYGLGIGEDCRGETTRN